MTMGTDILHSARREAVRVEAVDEWEYLGGSYSDDDDDDYDPNDPEH